MACEHNFKPRMAPGFSGRLYSALGRTSETTCIVCGKMNCDYSDLEGKHIYCSIKINVIVEVLINAQRK
jgi:hypothetical protein